MALGQSTIIFARMRFAPLWSDDVTGYLPIRLVVLMQVRICIRSSKRAKRIPSTHINISLPCSRHCHLLKQSTITKPCCLGEFQFHLFELVSINYRNYAHAQVASTNDRLPWIELRNT